MARVLVLIGLLIFLSFGAAGLSSVYQDTVTETQNETTIDNETFTVTINTTHSFNNTDTDNVFNDSVRVFQEDILGMIGTVEVESENGSNWVWHEGNGQLFVPEGSDLENGTANITYRYREPAPEQRAIKNIGVTPFQFSESLAIMAGFILLVLAVLQMAGTRR